MRINKKILGRILLSVVCVVSGASLAITYSGADPYYNNNPQVVDLSQDLQPPAAEESLPQSQPQIQSNQQTWEASASPSSTENDQSNNLNDQASQRTVEQYPQYSQPIMSGSVPPPSDSNGSNYVPTESSPSLDQRVYRLEQQLQNFTNMNMPQQITELQQQVQQLTGELQQDQHQIQVMKDSIKHLTSTTTTAAAVNHAQTTGNSSPSVTADASSEYQIYQTALNALNKKQYSSAQTEFKQYLQQYPQGQFAVNAYYWLGEIYLLDNHLDLAATQFSTLIAKYPSSTEASDAKLKLATIHLQQGQTDIARQEFESVQKSYPDSTAAHLATIQLQQMTTNRP